MIDIEGFFMTWKLLCVPSGEIHTRILCFPATEEKYPLLEILIRNC